MIENCLRNRTTVRFDFLHSFMVCAQTSAFWYTESWDFSTAQAYKYKTKRQAKMKRDSKKMTFLLISHHEFCFVYIDSNLPTFIIINSLGLGRTFIIHSFSTLFLIQNIYSAKTLSLIKQFIHNTALYFLIWKSSTFWWHSQHHKS